MKRIAFVWALIAAVACSPAPSGPEPTSSASTPTAPAPSSSESAERVRFLLYAIKEGDRVTLYRRPVPRGRAEVVLTYRETAEAASDSGNYYERLPPSVALDPSGARVVLTGFKGVAIHDLTTDRRRRLVKLVTPREGDTLPVWQPKMDAYSLVEPVWSADGRTVSFSRSQYEGSDEGFLQVDDGEYFEVEGMTSVYIGREPVRWASAATAWLAPRSEGWYASRLGDVRAYVTVDVETAQVVLDAYLSPDARSVVFTQGPFDGEPAESLWLARRDGSGLKQLSDSGPLSSPRFSPDGKNVLWIEGATQRLRRWSDGAVGTVAHLDDELQWAIHGWWDGAIALVARDIDGGSSRLLLIDADDGRILLRHRTDTGFTTYLGFSSALTA